MSDIKVDLRTNVVIDDKPAIAVIPDTNNSIDVTKSNKVKVQPDTYAIVRDDIYTIKKNNAPDQWFLDQINYTLEKSTLSTNVYDLDTRFRNFKDGITLEVGFLHDKDKELAYNLDVLKTSNDSNTAAIQNLDITKVTADEASAIASTVIGAWQANGEGGAFIENVMSTNTDLTKATAKSAANLTATMQSQQNQIESAFGDINTLKKQIDGVVETWFYDADAGNNGPNQNGTPNIDLTAEPYATWNTESSKSIHTGDTYVLYTTDLTTGEKTLQGSWRFAKSTINEPETDSEGYMWALITSDTANKAYEVALKAQATADGKITTYYQASPPTSTVYPELSEGDIWIDSGAGNQMWRYQGNPLQWTKVDDTRISASVQRLDEATVTVDGKAVARSSLVVGAGNAASGFVVAAADSPSGTPSSSFKIFANKFEVADNLGQGNVPFRIENGKIYFNGVVQFSNVEGSEGLATKDDLNGVNGTIIDGSAIKTGTVDAAVIKASSKIVAPVIVGGTIEGGEIKGVNITGSVIKSSWIDFSGAGALTSWKYYTPSTVPAQYKDNFAKNPDGSLVVTDGYVRLPTSTVAVASDAGGTASAPMFGFPSSALAYAYKAYGYDTYTINTTARAIEKDMRITVQDANNKLIDGYVGKGETYIEFSFYVKNTSMDVVVYIKDLYPRTTVLRIGGVMQPMQNGYGSKSYVVEGIKVTMSFTDSGNPYAGGKTHVILSYNGTYHKVLDFRGSDRIGLRNAIVADTSRTGKITARLPAIKLN